MNNLEKILKNKKIITIITCIIIVIGISAFLYRDSKQYENMDTIEVLEEAEEDLQQNNTNIQNQQNADSNQIQEETKNAEKIAIHITGEVKKKGILYLDKGTRIDGAIQAAGGPTKDANLDQVNLAYILEDGQKIYIPNKKEKIEPGAYIIANNGNNILVEDGKNINNINTDVKTNINTNTKGVNGKVNINSANQTELETLPGIGPSLAQRIIEYRETNGTFKKIDDIQNVKGIGDSKYSNIKANICI